MKKIKASVAWLCALLFLLSAFAFAACKHEESSALPSESESFVSDTTDEIFPIESSDSAKDEESVENSSLPDASSSDGEEYSSSPVESSSKGDTSTTGKPPKQDATDTPPKQETTARYAYCVSDSVNIRSGAGTSYSVLGTAKKGTIYAIVGKTGNWYKTYYRNRVAYLSASYFSVLEIEKSDDSRVEKVLDEGYKLLGTPYVYGATRVHDGTGKLLGGFSSQKFDCSSLVQYVFYKGANKLLQVHTRTQVKQGTYVKPSQLRRGDCIFFTNEDRQYNTGIERIGHVAVYLGDDYILHTASDYARIEKMTTRRWNFYVEARRFL